MNFMKERGFGNIDGTWRRETGGRPSAESKEQSEKRKMETIDRRPENGNSKDLINIAIKSRLL